MASVPFITLVGAPFAKHCPLLRRPTRFYLGSRPGSWPACWFGPETRRGRKISLGKLGPPTARALVMFHLITGEIEKAADWCERVIEQHDGTVAFSTTYPLYKPLRESPRWPKLAKMMNLPEGV